MWDSMWEAIAADITRVTGHPFHPTQQRSIGGGSINQAYCLTDGQRRFFVKLNQVSRLAMFEVEAQGLQQIADTHTIRVPLPLCWGTTDRAAYLVLEWLDLGSNNRQGWAVMGQQLAAMHRVTSPQGFGWERSNIIGETPQMNPWTASWVEFFSEHRLGYQFRLAERRGGHFPQKAELLAAIPDLLAGHEPPPSLVHGDLWTGNAALTRDGEPVILDPAVYFGDREVDLAMSQLFGSLPPEFYRAYEQAYPLPPGYVQRQTLYNLYHILNHFNQFGGGYAAQANRMIASLL